MAGTHETDVAAPVPVAEPPAAAPGLDAPSPLAAALSPAAVLSLQRRAGNQAVTRWLSRQAAAPAPAPAPAPAEAPRRAWTQVETVYEFPQRKVPGSPFEVAGKLGLTIAHTGNPTASKSGTDGRSEVSALDLKTEQAKSAGQKWSRAFATTLAKADFTVAEPIKGVKLSGSFSVLELKIAEGEEVDVSLLKVSGEIAGDVPGVFADEGGALAQLVEGGFSIKVAGAVEVNLDPTAAAQLARAQAAEARAAKVAADAAELAKRNEPAVRRLRQGIAARQAVLDKGTFVDRAGRVRKLTSTKRAKLVKEIAARRRQLDTLAKAFDEKKALAKAAQKELNAAVDGMSTPIGKRWGAALVKRFGTKLFKLLGALGIATTVHDLVFFVYAVAKAGIDPGFHDKGDSGTPGGDPDTPATGDAGGAGGDGSGVDLESDEAAPLGDDEVVDVEQPQTAALHPNAQQLVEALMGEAVSGVKGTDLEAFNHLVPADLTPEEVELLISLVRGAGARSVDGIKTAVIRAMRELRERQSTAADPSAATVEGAGGLPQGTRAGDETRPDEKVLDVRYLEFRVVAGLDPDRSYAEGESVTVSIVVTQDFESVPVTFGARVLRQERTDATDVIYLENAGQWRATKRDGTEIFMGAGQPFSAAWARDAPVPAAAP